MKKLILTASALALIPAAANAQLLGGGSGSIGGGLGGVVTNTTGSATSTINRGGAASRISTRQTVRTPDVSAPDTQAPEVSAPQAPAVPSDVSAVSNASGNLTTRAGSVSAAANSAVGTSDQALAAAASVNGGIEPVAIQGLAEGGAVTAPATPIVTVPVTRVVTVGAPLPIANIAARRTAFVTAGVAPISRSYVNTYVDTQFRTIERDLQGTGASVERRGEQIIIQMPGDVTFAFDKSDIRPRFHGVLNALSGTLSDYPATFVDIIGHTDSKGSDAYNVALSERRAMSVAGYLSARTPNRARMQIEGRGEFEPVDTNTTVQGRAANRRVEIILTPYAE